MGHSVLRLDATAKKKDSIENSSNSKNLALNKQLLVVVWKWKEGWKKVENQDKKTSNFFCLGASTWRDKMPLIKVAYFMLNFLNSKSYLSNLFFCSSIQPQHAVGWDSILMFSLVSSKFLAMPNITLHSIHIFLGINNCLIWGKDVLRDVRCRWI